MQHDASNAPTAPMQETAKSSTDGCPKGQAGLRVRLDHQVPLAHLSTSRRVLPPYSTSLSACLTRGSSSASRRLAR